MTDWAAFLEETAREMCSKLRARGALVRPEAVCDDFATSIATTLNLDEKSKQRLIEEFLPVFADGLAARSN
jgi:hypothetical protein